MEKASKFQALVSTIVGALPAIAAGQVGAAAGKVEQTLERLVPLALGFVADFIGLGGLTDAVRAQLQKAREWVQKIIQRLIEKVGKLVGKGVESGKQVTSKVGEFAKGFFGVRTIVNASPQEQHHLSFQRRGNKPVLIIESTPQEIRDFLTAYARKYPGKRIGLLQEIKNHLDSYDPLYTALQPDLDAATFAVRRIHAQLLAKNDLLSDMLRRLLIGDPKSPLLAAEIAHYKLEGITGIYANRPEITGDKLTFDHQPQAAVWEVASDLRFTRADGKKVQLFAPTSPLALRAADRADNGYAINLSAVRHQLGRTYGTPGQRTKEAFEQSSLKVIADSTLSEQEKRNAIVELLKDELRKDVAAMLQVISAQNTKAWTDIAALGLNPVEQRLLQDAIIARIKQGERELQNQPMAQLRAGV